MIFSKDNKLMIMISNNDIYIKKKNNNNVNLLTAFYNTIFCC